MWRMMPMVVSMAGMCMIVVVMRVLCGSLARAEKGHEHEAPGIERGEARRDQRHQEAVGGSARMDGSRIGGFDDRIL
jgi:hypothetical protein